MLACVRVFVVVIGALEAVESHLVKIVYFGVRVMRSSIVFGMCPGRCVSAGLGSCGPLATTARPRASRVNVSVILFGCTLLRERHGAHRQVPEFTHRHRSMHEPAIRTR